MSILRDRPDGLKLVMPSVCFMEALIWSEGQKKRHKTWLQSIDKELGEARRNFDSGDDPLIHHLDQVRTWSEVSSLESRNLLFQALEILGANAELIHPTPQILHASQRDSLILDQTDNLILTSILEHSRGHPSATKLFLSENHNDFNQGKAKLALREAGIKYFADASKFLQWHRARPEE